MTSKSTRLTSFKSSVTFVPPAFICAFNSSICSRRMRPISLSVVVCPSESFSILKVTFFFSQVPRLNRCTLSATCNSVELEVFLVWQRAAFSAFAENSAWSSGVWIVMQFEHVPLVQRADPRGQYHRAVAGGSPSQILTRRTMRSVPPRGSGWVRSQTLTRRTHEVSTTTR